MELNNFTILKIYFYTFLKSLNLENIIFLILFIIFKIPQQKNPTFTNKWEINAIKQHNVFIKGKKHPMN